MKLHHNPFQIFYGSKTPAGLYARQKWLGEESTLAWQNDFKSCVDALFVGQLPNGSWQQSSIATIINLFGLHLTVRKADKRINDALEWLLDKIQLISKCLCVQTDSDIMRADLSSLPFVLSRSEMLFTGATLFLFSIFNRQNDPTILAIYQWLNKEGFTRENLNTDIASMHNIFRSLVVHPKFTNEDLTVKIAEIYAGLQNEKGDWAYGLPFYQTLNALGHLNLSQAEIQLERAFTRLIKTQKSDGTWGGRDLEWNTFLSIHVLKNKGLL
ncbi:MAG: hypothetical protein KJO34_03340 [Deltaproteobacteria bacterium]|nr:hypothetical protein [Deltaproteobacteria bacterium]